MKISGGLENVHKMDATLTITMTLDEWKQLQSQLAQAWPSWKLGSAISALWSKARKEYDEQIDTNAV